MREIIIESHLVCPKPLHHFNKITRAQAPVSMKRVPQCKKRHNIRVCSDVNLHSNKCLNMLRWYHPKIPPYNDLWQPLMQWTITLQLKRWIKPILSAPPPKTHTQREELQPKAETQSQYRQFRFIRLRREFRLRRNSNESTGGMLKICAMITSN